MLIAAGLLVQNLRRNSLKKYKGCAEDQSDNLDGKIAPAVDTLL